MNKRDELIKKLRSGRHGWLAHNLSRDAAAQIERDGREIERLREALRFYGDVSKYPTPFTGGMGDLWADCGETARAALQQEGGT